MEEHVWVREVAVEKHRCRHAIGRDHGCDPASPIAQQKRRCDDEVHRDAMQPFNQKQFSFLKSNLVVRTDLWAYFSKSRRAGTAAPDALSRSSTIKDFVRCANRDVPQIWRLTCPSRVYN